VLAGVQVVVVVVVMVILLLYGLYGSDAWSRERVYFSSKTIRSKSICS
jgi:hypothetical protein